MNRMQSVRVCPAVRKSDILRMSCKEFDVIDYVTAIDDGVFDVIDLVTFDLFQMTRKYPGFWRRKDRRKNKLRHVSSYAPGFQMETRNNIEYLLSIGTGSYLS